MALLAWGTAPRAGAIDNIVTPRLALPPRRCKAALSLALIDNGYFRARTFRNLHEHRPTGFLASGPICE
jgi:hypothetical protein